jgi:cytochrome c biogenesis protein ResB
MLTPDGEKTEKIIEVNKPFKYKSWYLYQTDCRYILLNPDSTDPFRISTLQAVRDPWLKFVYVGFGMLFIGVIYLMWSIRKFPKESK